VAGGGDVIALMDAREYVTRLPEALTQPIGDTDGPHREGSTASGKKLASAFLNKFVVIFIEFAVLLRGVRLWVSPVGDNDRAIWRRSNRVPCN
jgi:hypothetical protein